MNDYVNTVVSPTAVFVEEAQRANALADLLPRQARYIICKLEQGTLVRGRRSIGIQIGTVLTVNSFRDPSNSAGARRLSRLLPDATNYDTTPYYISLFRRYQRVITGPIQRYRNRRRGVPLANFNRDRDDNRFDAAALTGFNNAGQTDPCEDTSLGTYVRHLVIFLTLRCLRQLVERSPARTLEHT